MAYETEGVAFMSVALKPRKFLKPLWLKVLCWFPNIQVQYTEGGRKKKKQLKFNIFHTHQLI